MVVSQLRSRPHRERRRLVRAVEQGERACHLQVELAPLARRPLVAEQRQPFGQQLERGLRVAGVELGEREQMVGLRPKVRVLREFEQVDGLARQASGRLVLLLLDVQTRLCPVRPRECERIAALHILQHAGEELGRLREAADIGQRVGEENAEPEPPGWIVGGVSAGERRPEERNRRFRLAQTEIRPPERVGRALVAELRIELQRPLEKVHGSLKLIPTIRDLTEPRRDSCLLRARARQWPQFPETCLGLVDMVEPKRQLGVPQRGADTRLMLVHPSREPGLRDAYPGGELPDHLERRHALAGLHEGDVAGAATGEREPPLAEACRLPSRAKPPAERFAAIYVCRYLSGHGVILSWKARRRELTKGERTVPVV